MSAVLAALLLATSTAPAISTPPSRTPHVIQEPDWAVMPSGADMTEAYPRAASRARVTGRVKLHCNVRVDGHVDHCFVLEETPPGWGFGEATLKFAERWRFRPKMVDGVPVEGGKVIVPINWAIDETPQFTATPTVAEAEARDPEALKLGRRIADLTADLDLSVEGVETAYGEWIRPMFERGDAARSQAFAEAFKTSFDEFRAKRRDRVAAAFVFAMSRDELKATVEFLETPAGAAFARRLPEVIGRSYIHNEELTSALLDAWQTRYCAKVACDDKDLNSFNVVRTTRGPRPPSEPPPAETPRDVSKD